MSHRLPAPVVRSVGTLVLIVLAGVGACSNGSEPAADRVTPSPTPASVAADLSSLQVPREEFCDRVPEVLLSDVLGSAPEAETWRNGDPLPQAGPDAVGHEYGCRWSAAGASAAAWVYAPPADDAGAKRWGRQVVSTAAEGCRSTRAAAEFGRHPVALHCRGTGAAGPSATWAGLFGDAWLVCSWNGAGAASKAADFCPALVTAAAQG